jgi:hypothetical protein
LREKFTKTTPLPVSEADANHEAEESESHELEQNGTVLIDGLGLQGQVSEFSDDTVMVHAETLMATARRPAKIMSRRPAESPQQYDSTYHGPTSTSFEDASYRPTAVVESLPASADEEWMRCSLVAEASKQRTIVPSMQCLGDYSYIPRRPA